MSMTNENKTHSSMMTMMTTMQTHFATHTKKSHTHFATQ